MAYGFFTDSSFSGRSSFDQRHSEPYGVGRGYRAMLHGCPRDLIIRSAVELRDGQTTIDAAFDTIHQAALDSGSALLRLRALDLAQQLPVDDTRRTNALAHHTAALNATDDAELASDRALIAVSNKWPVSIARNVGMTAHHLLNEGMLSVGSTMLQTAERLGLSHETMDTAWEHFEDLAADQYGDDDDAHVMHCDDGLKPRYAPRGTWNKHASPAWGRALDS